MKEKLVSILIPCYNDELYLEECLKAILNQTYSNIEVIIVNDGSTDDSEKIMDKYQKEFLRKKKRFTKINQKNQGQASACNTGLKSVRGEYLYWQDADDVIEKNTIKTLVDFLEKHKEYDLVRGNAAIRKEEDFQKVVSIHKPIQPLEENVFEEFLYEKGTWCFSGIFMVRMSHFDKCNPKRNLYESQGGQNYQILLPILYKAKCGYVDQVVYNYRISSSSHSHSIKTKKEQIKRWNIHQKTILKTLNQMKKMSFKDKIYYKYRTRIKYLNKEIRLMIPKKVKDWLLRR